MENGTIPNDDITASSIWDNSHNAYNARLNNKHSDKGIGSWVPKGQRKSRT